MAEYIERKAAIDELNGQIECCNKALGSFDIALKDEYAVKVERASLVAYKEQLEALPAADVVPVVHSQWIEDGDPLMLTCGNCGYGVMRYNNTPFCPNCGAKMDGGDERETD